MAVQPRCPRKANQVHTPRLPLRPLHLLLLLAPGVVSLSFTRADAEPLSEQIRLIDSPTAGLTDKGRFGIDMRFFPNGGVSTQLHAGVLSRLTVGISFGGEQIIGDQDIDWYPRVEAAVKYRLIEENTTWPALVLGYETQGYGTHKNDRYQIKSKGFLVVLSKNYISTLGQFGIHGGFNLSRENRDDDDLSGWLGIDKDIGGQLALVAEYDPGFNDNALGALGSGRGYLNAGGRWSVGPQLTLGFYIKDMLGNAGEGKAKWSNMSRELTVLYAEEF